MDELLGIFIEDMKEYLYILNDSIIKLEKDRDNKLAVNEMFRAFHTMKSSTAAMEFKKTAGFIHRMEDLLHEIREGRIKVNGDIIKLLYKSNDMLEHFLDRVIQNESEDDIDSCDIINEVDKIINPDSAKKPMENNTGEVHEINANPSLSDNDLEKLKTSLSDGYQAYKLTVTIYDDCAFKSVRAWMILEEISKYSEIIRSYPEKPGIDDFRNGKFIFDDTVIRAIITSDTAYEDLLQEFRSSMSEVDSIVLDEIKNDIKRDEKKDELSEIIDGIIGEDTGHGARSGQNPCETALPDIQDKIKACEILLLEFETDQFGPNDIMKIADALRFVSEAASFASYGLISEISLKCCVFSEFLHNNGIKLEKVSVNILAELLALIKRLCKNTSLEKDAHFLEEVGSKYELLQSIMEMAKSDASTDKALSNSDKIGDILVHTGHLNKDDVEDIIKKQKENYPGLKFGQIAVKEDKAELKDVIHALNVQENVKTEQKSQAFIRIPAHKVDNLVDLLGELLITQSLHKQEISDISDRDTNRILNNIIRMERIAKEIQNITMSMRMVSLKQTFQKIYRIGRDTAVQLGKNVEIFTSGEDTEIDRNVVDKIHDPLMHLIRNSISHGIEDEEERLKKGKSGRGNISIQAYNRRGNVYIEVSDDGRGLSVDKIYRKALEKGLADPARKYADDEILKLIYLPGFSTEESVNSISGRGVGMNVVQTEISRLGGKIDIENRPPAGCSFILKIPVNLATINGTIVDIFGDKYVIPTLGIKQILKPRTEQWVSVKSRRSSILVRDNVLQVIPIGSILRTPVDDEKLENSLIMVIEHEKKLMALPVKSILGKQEVVVKPIGSDFSNLNFISGATILGDGRVSLILDVESLFRMTEDMEP